MALIKCPECGREVSDQAKTCPQCGFKVKLIKKREKKSRAVDGRKIMKYLVIIIPSVLVLSFCVYFFLSPKTFEWCCLHRIDDATCTEPETCRRCGKTWGTKKDHIWLNATCTEPRTCVACGITEGLALGHSWKEATCLNPKTCTVCGITEGDIKDHDWKGATCTEPKTCRTCGKIEGTAKGHAWVPATCTTPKKCKTCGRTEGSALGHNIVDYICTRCNNAFVSKTDVPNILDITEMHYDINSVGGIDQNMRFSNKSSTKTINYIYLTMEFYNAVGDVITDEISRKKSVRLMYTGPLKPGKTSSTQYWDACFYNSTYSGTTNILEIEIQYSDGTTLILEDSIANNAVKAWR